MRKAHDALVGRRERKKVQTREAIVAAALDLFERKGYDATTIEEIAEAVDVSPRTFFRYFDSKVEVIMESKEDREGFSGLLADRPPEEGPVEAMRQVIRRTLGQMVSGDPTFVRQMRVMLATPSLRADAREHFNEHQTEMAQEFAARLGVGEDDLQPHIVAAAVGNTLWTVVTRWVEEDAPPERLLTMIDEACALLSKGLE
jgi:AcrR family transcriptional regulator